jgi:hypothetical protein
MPTATEVSLRKKRAQRKKKKTPRKPASTECKCDRKEANREARNSVSQVKVKPSQQGGSPKTGEKEEDKEAC